LAISPPARRPRPQTECRPAPAVRDSGCPLRHLVAWFSTTDDVIAQVLDVVWPVRAKCRAFLRSKKLTAGVLCVAAEHGRGPAYTVSPRTIRRLGYLGAELAFDIYHYGPDT
jgi:hypothetical protein